MDHGTRPKGQASVGLGATRNSDLGKPAKPATQSSAETVDGLPHLDGSRHAGGAKSSASSSAARAGSATKQKICVACGRDVAHEERFKDRAGHYWCMDCGVKENREHHTLGHAATETVACPDCQQSVAPGELVEHAGKRLCAACAEKREAAAKREAAREAARRAAALQEALDDQRRRRNLLIAAGVAAAVAVGWAAYAVAF